MSDIYGYRASATSRIIERFQVVKINPATIRYKDYGGIKLERTEGRWDDYAWFSTFEDAAAWLLVILRVQHTDAVDVVSKIEQAIGKLNDRKFRDVVPLEYNGPIEIE